MGDTKTEIANLALRHLGTGKRISDFDNDDSEEAKVMRDLFDHWMGMVLRGYNWNFAKVYQNVEPIIVYPNQAWKFAYRMPSDCKFFRRFWNGHHIDDRDNIIDWDLSNDSQGRIILSNFGPGSALNTPAPTGTPSSFIPPSTSFTIAPGDLVPVIEYTQNYQNMAFWPDDFIFAFSLMLAAWAAPSLPGPGMVDLREKNIALGSPMMEAAMARDAMEARISQERVSLLAKSRHGGRIAFTQAGWQELPANFTP